VEKKYKIAIVIGIILVLILGAIVVYLVLANRALNNDLANKSVTVTATVTKSATKTATKTSTVTATETETQAETQFSKNDEELIKKALAEKYGQAVENLTVTIDKTSQNAASGGVLISGEQGGGWFVTVREGAGWIIIADGNGAIECAIMDQYSVPNTVVAECTDFDTGEVKIR